MTKPIRAKATQMNNPEYTSLWAGTGFTLAKELPAHLIVEELVQELNEMMQNYGVACFKCKQLYIKKVNL